MERRRGWNELQFSEVEPRSLRDGGDSRRFIRPVEGRVDIHGLPSLHDPDQDLLHRLRYHPGKRDDVGARVRSMKHERAPGSENASHFGELMTGFGQMLDHHVRGDQVEASVAKRQTGDIAQTQVPNRTMALERLRVGVQPDDERRLGDESFLRFAAPLRENAMPTSEIEPRPRPSYVREEPLLEDGLRVRQSWRDAVLQLAGPIVEPFAEMHDSRVVCRRQVDVGRRPLASTPLPPRSHQTSANPSCSSVPRICPTVRKCLYQSVNESWVSSSAHSCLLYTSD